MCHSHRWVTNHSKLYSIGGLVKVVHYKTLMIKALRLGHLNDARNLIGKEGVIDVHKQMLLALSMQCIPRIDHVLHMHQENPKKTY